MNRLMVFGKCVKGDPRVVLGAVVLGFVDVVMDLIPPDWVDQF